MKLTENTIENAFIAQLVTQGYTYYNAVDIAPDNANPQRESLGSVILEKKITKL